MASQKIITAKVSFINRLFGKFYSVSLKDDVIMLHHKSKGYIEYSLAEVNQFSKFEKSFFGKNICLGVNQIKLPKVIKKDNDELYDAIQKIIAKNIEKHIEPDIQLFEELVIKQYLRDSNIELINERLNFTIQFHKNNRVSLKKYCSEKFYDNLKKIVLSLPLNQSSVQQVRKTFESRQLLERKNFFDVIESNPLTEEQRLSVIRNNDINLVLAAAGTGKTSVMVAKTLDLIESGIAKSSDILVLAYNRDAAKELAERLVIRAETANVALEEPPSISTFHALGRKIINDCGESIHLSKFVEDPMTLDLWFNNWLESYIQEAPENLVEFLELAYQPINAFNFQSKEEYDRYVRDNEYRTLKGERVRGYQELLIANWLFENGVSYEYEPRYKSKRRIDIGFDYKPDFYLFNDIYLEHFGINRQGKTRPDIDAVQYNENIRKKRALHEEHGTILIETYHYDWAEENLFVRLTQLMAEHDIPLKPKTEKEMLDALNSSGIFKENKNRYLKCLQAIRAERLDYEEILSRLKKAKIVHSEKYSVFLVKIHNAYIYELKSRDEIDFDDMILKATALIKLGRFVPQWKHILVDEFQDISMARLELLKQIYNRGQKPILTVVGDDWQSIYRFSGGKLEVTTRFNEMMGSHSLSKLEKTYRYNNSIAKTAGQFIMENPEQYRKNVITHNQVSNSCVRLFDSYVCNPQTQNEEPNISVKALSIFQQIRREHPDASIAVLARYRYILEDAKKIIKDKNVRFWTFHGSKGLEADYCILLGFFQGKTGFPNQNKEDAVVEALLPMLDTYPHSEERRLLYVALTRAKKESYLIADADSPSEFINELLSPKYEIDIASERFQNRYRAIFKCATCSTGYFVLKQGKFGNFYSCTTGSICNSSPRICEECGSPSVDNEYTSICQNPNCSNEFPICNKCGRPMKLRDGKFGKFWGCSGYGLKDDMCKNTRKMAWN